MGWGAGMAATIWRPAGLSIAVNLGGWPIFSSRSMALQPESTVPARTETRAAAYLAEWLRMARSYRLAVRVGLLMTPPSARTVPGAVTVADIIRYEAGFCMVTVSPTPPSLMARPVAVTSTPGALNVIVTTWPLLTTMG